jgi:hypothetical protein
MKVRELIEKLQLCDPESYIVTVDNESGWNDYNAVWKMSGSLHVSQFDTVFYSLSEYVRDGDDVVEVVAISPYGHDGYPEGAVEVA